MSKFIGGKLKFKGSFQKKIQEDEAKIKKDLEKANEEEFHVPEKNHSPKKQLIEYQIQQGSGRILTSGKAIHGKDTFFMKELKLGDEIIVTNPTSLLKETRKVTAILSDKSAGFNEPLTVDLVSYSQYEFRKQNELREKDLSLDEKYQIKLNDMSKKIKKEDTSVLEFREKKGMWGYRKIQKELPGELTKEQLLDMRSKKNRDKFCWI